MAIGPHGLQGVAAHAAQADQLKSIGGERALGLLVNIAQDVGLTLAAGAGAAPPQHWQWNVTLRTIIPLDGEFVPDALNVSGLHGKNQSRAASAARLRASTSACKDRPWASIVTTAGKSSTSNSQMASGAPNFSII